MALPRLFAARRDNLRWLDERLWKAVTRTTHANLYLALYNAVGQTKHINDICTYTLDHNLTHLCLKYESIKSRLLRGRPITSYIPTKREERRFDRYRVELGVGESKPTSRTKLRTHT